MTFIQTAPGFVLTNLHLNAQGLYLNILSSILRFAGLFLATSWEDSGEYTLFGLLQSGPGARWIGPRGEDMGRWKYDEEESEFVVAHLKEATSV
jgi:hypothetical protein